MVSTATAIVQGYSNTALQTLSSSASCGIIY